MAKIIIVGSGKISREHVEKILEATGHKSEDVIVIKDTESDIIQLAEDLVLLKSKEVQQLLNVQEIDTIAYTPAYCYKDYEKNLSQQGWKKRPKHRR